MSTMSQFFSGGGGGVPVGSTFTDTNPRATIAHPPVITQGEQTFVLENGALFSLSQAQGDEAVTYSNNISRISPWEIVDFAFSFTPTQVFYCKGNFFLFDRVNNKGAKSVDGLAWTEFTLPTANASIIATDIINSFFERGDGSYMMIVGGYANLYSNHEVFVSTDGLSWITLGLNYLQTAVSSAYDVGDMGVAAQSPDKQRIVIPILRSPTAGNSNGLSYIVSSNGGTSWSQVQVYTTQYSADLTAFHDPTSDRMMVMGQVRDSGTNAYYPYLAAATSNITVTSWQSFFGTASSTQSTTYMTNFAAQSGTSYVNNKTVVSTVTFEPNLTIAAAAAGTSIFRPLDMDGPSVAIGTKGFAVSNYISKYTNINTAAGTYDTELVAPSIAGSIAWAPAKGIVCISAGSVFHLGDFYADPTVFDKKTTYITNNTGGYRRFL